jgi:hypothetical protein
VLALQLIRSIMATNEVQKRYLERKRLGISAPTCAGCGTKLTILSKNTNEAGELICGSCWYKTPDGREYMREKQKASRERQKKK